MAAFCNSGWHLSTQKRAKGELCLVSCSPTEMLCLTGKSSDRPRSQQKDSLCHHSASPSQPGDGLWFVTAISAAEATTPQMSKSCIFPPSTPRLLCLLTGHQLCRGHELWGTPKASLKVCRFGATLTTGNRGEHWAGMKTQRIHIKYLTC